MIIMRVLDQHLGRYHHYSESLIDPEMLTEQCPCRHALYFLFFGKPHKARMEHRNNFRSRWLEILSLKILLHVLENQLSTTGFKLCLPRKILQTTLIFLYWGSTGDAMSLDDGPYSVVWILGLGATHEYTPISQGYSRLDQLQVHVRSSGILGTLSIRGIQSR